MSVRQDILNAARTDMLTINGTGSFTNDLETAFKSFRYLEQLNDSDFDSCYVKLGTAERTKLPDNIRVWQVPLIGLIYFKSNMDTTNQGLLETKAETLVADLELLNWSNIKAVEENSMRVVESVELATVLPYITEYEDRGIIYFELKIIYY